MGGGEGGIEGGEGGQRGERRREGGGGRTERQQTHGVTASGFDEICTCGGTERDGRGETRSATAFSVTEPLSFVHAHAQRHRHTDTVALCDGGAQQIDGAAALTSDAVRVFSHAAH